MMLPAMRRPWQHVWVGETVCYAARISGKAKAPMEPPDEYLCPITQELMHDPVIASDGHTYERDAIERWFSKKLFSPKTGSDLETSALFPNHVMRRQIIEWKEAHQEA